MIAAYIPREEKAAEKKNHGIIGFPCYIYRKRFERQFQKEMR